MREAARKGDSSLRLATRAAIKSRVDDRLDYLSELLPEQFGQTKAEGLSPAQAILITYSVAADDLLNGSQKELQDEIEIRRQITSKPVTSKWERKAYGPNGVFFSTPLQLFFNTNTMGDLLTSIEEKGARK